MQSTKWSFEVRQLFKETAIRYPHQKLEPQTEKAYLQDWIELCGRVGLERFTEGVKRARGCCDFFPMISKIAELSPEPRNENRELLLEMADLKRRKEAGEKFYSLSDVFTEVARRINCGELVPKDPGWKVWARSFITA